MLFRSSVIPALSEDKPHVRDGTVSPELETVQKQDEAHGDKQPLNHSKEELDNLIEEAEKQLEKSDVKLKFKVLEEDDGVQVEIVDPDGKTIRKIPGDDLLKLSKSLKNLERGFLDEVS